MPGMTAAMTQLPVLGVPVQSKALSGQDSLLSIVQMPAGIPVMNMVGAVNHVAKACDVGVDLVCAQGADAGLCARGGVLYEPQIGDPNRRVAKVRVVCVRA